MTRVEKMRMCPYCEGTNLISSNTCRFCASTFEEEKKEVPVKTQRVNADHLQYTPPYAPASTLTKESVYHREATENYEEEEENSEHGHIVSLTLLSCGCMLLTISMLLLFFSQHGRVVLEWKSRYWSLYLLMGLPMIYYGIKKLREI